MSSKVESIMKRQRAKAAKEFVVYSGFIGGEFGDLLNALGNMMVENDVTEERCGMQNVKATQSVMLMKTIGNA